jgi:hypothetical protein
MGQVIALLLQVLGILTPLLNYVQTILGFASKAAQETAPLILQTIASNAANTVNSPTFGNSALHDQLTALQASVATLQQAAVPVHLPPVAPPGYGGGGGSTAAEVWAYPMPSTNQPAANMMENAGLLGVNLGTVRAQFPLVNQPYYSIGGTWWSAFGPNGANSTPSFPVANILPTDTLITFLERESFYNGWGLIEGGYATIYDGSGGDDFFYTTNITAAEFILLRDGGGTVTLTGVPPVWPGFAHATLTGPFPIVPLTTITEPMEGCFIDIINVTTNKPKIPYGTKDAWRFLGALAFVTDNGHVEPWQQLAFAQAIYCPLSMEQAAAVVIRADAGIVGTVRPWHKV